MLKHLLLLTLIGYAFSKRDSSECGVTKKCLYFPEGCNLSESSCILFTYSYNSTSNNFKMELSGGTGNGNHYSAVAFSNVAKMENMDVYFCTGDELLTGKVEKQYADPVIDSSTLPEVTDITAETIDGIAQCSFTRSSSVKRVLQGSSINFDLSKNSFYVLWARGAYSGTPQYHDDRGISTSKLTANIEALASECEKTVGCFRQPANCIPGTDCMFFSWIYDESNNQFEFTIVGKQRSTESYLAFAFATSQMMQDADVYYCTKDKLGVSQITDLGAQPIDVSDPDIKEVSSREEDGNIICTFTRPAAQTRQISNGGSKVFDLKKEKFFLLYCIAPVSSSGGMEQHRSHDDRGASTTSIDFTTFTGGTGGEVVSITVKLIRAHAVLMMLAWMLFSNIGIVMARHYKPLWPDNKINGKAAWFQVHRFVMVTTAICTIAAIICIFSAIQGYSTRAGSHPIIGIVVTILTITNPIMAGIRPAPDSPNRWIFNIGHFIVGYSARLLSIAAIFLGVKLDNWFENTNITTWIMVGFVVNQVIVEVLLEFISAVNGHVKTKYSKTGNNSRAGFNQKYLLLAYSVLTNIGFVAAISYYIVRN